MAHFDVRAWEEFLGGGHVRTFHEAPVPIWAGFIIEQLGRLMSDQDTLNTYVAEIAAAAAAISTEIAAKQAQAPGLDFTGLQSAVAKLTALEPPVAADPAQTVPASTDSAAVQVDSAAKPADSAEVSPSSASGAGSTTK
ncbi:hypothetical protein G4X40_19790 [Rhodococcus sp. D2-41]|uniref:Uncharacterized protein n=1 Tax=Speluncibacter jeojiensis TaxID=2710754 RepID=A0A9X4LW98_9ACTN|nr:hypothetical protein [Rhodococcus sp. D2-41]MDG3012386.1 hypothetical protein [Rhodococcus sp. D2-41]MDG3013558.1 hypothetical protein [Corynebacteriales bacterium D3-21]